MKLLKNMFAFITTIAFILLGINFVLYATESAKADSVENINIASVSFIGNEGGNAAIGLYRVNLASAMSNSANTTFATPNTVVQKQDGNSAADIRGEGTTNTLIVRVPYGRVQTGASSISDLTDGTKITIKSGIPFTLDNGTFSFTEDVELIYTTGATSFIRYVEPTSISVNKFEFLGNESNAVGLYRITLAADMDSVAGITFATPNTVVQNQDGNSAADIRGESTTNTLIVRVPYGRIQTGASSISDLTDGTKITIKSGIPFTLDNGTFSFTEDVELVYYQGADRFIPYVEPVELSISELTYLGFDSSPAFGLYRITLSSDMDTVAGITFATPNTVVQKQDGNSAADIRGEGTTNTLIVRMPYGRVKSGATSVNDLDEGTTLIIKGNTNFTLDNGVFFFDKDTTIVLYKSDNNFHIQKEHLSDKQVSVVKTEFLMVTDNPLAFDYNLYLSDSIVCEEQLVTCKDRYENPKALLVNSNNEFVGYVFSTSESDCLMARIYVSTVSASGEIDDIEDALLLRIAKNEQYTFDSENFFEFDKDIEFCFNKADGKFCVLTKDNDDKYIVYDNDLEEWIKLQPNFEVAINDRVVEGDVIYAPCGKNKNILSVRAYDASNSDMEVSVSIPDEVFDVDDNFVLGDYSITVNATDNMGVFAEKTFTLKVVDGVEPTVTLISFKQDYSQGDQLEFEASVTDNIDDLTVDDIKVLYPDGAINENGLLPGNWDIKLYAEDSNHNVGYSEVFSIVVHDTVSPVITITGVTEYEAGITYHENSVLDLNISVIDNVDGEITNYEVITPQGFVVNDKIQAGVWTITVKAYDSEKNEGTASIEITVVDTQAPEITINSNNKVSYYEKDVPSFSVTAIDYAEGAIDVEYIYPENCLDGDGKLTIGNGTWTITVKAVDKAGNVSTKSFNIFVEPKDTTAPVITIIGERNYTEGDKLNLIVLANDDVDGNISVDVVKPDGMENAEGKLNQGTWIVEYSAIDGAGNTAVENVTIVVAGAGGGDTKSGGCNSNINGNWFILLAISTIFIVMAKRKKTSK